MKKIGVHTRKFVAALLVSTFLIFGSSPQLPVLAVLPAKAATVSGVTVYSNSSAAVDASNLSEGYVMVRYTGGKNTRIKVQITKSGSGTTYTYNLNSSGSYETFPLTEGSGSYTIKVFENAGGSKYAQVQSVDVTMKLRNELLPFLYSNQYVNFSDSSATVSKARELTAGKSSDIDKVSAVFNYVVDNTTYDYDKAATVQSGYLPTVDTTLSTHKGICFDYAALMTAMLRSQGIPCKLIIGYAGETYHAWINVYIEGSGWVDSVIYFDGKTWTLMDPTFVSSGQRSKDTMTYVTTPSNYSQKYAY